MTDADDKLSRRYREASREEPPAHLDAAILAASRRAVGAGPRARKPAWMVPASIAAVLVLGIGLSLRMQLEQPGIETSAPGGSAEYPVPQATEPAQVPGPQPKEAQPPVAQPQPAPSAPAAPRVRAEPEAKRRAQAQARPEEQADRALRKDSAATEPPAIAMSEPAAAPASPPPPATVTAPATPPAPSPAAGAVAAPQAALRPKLEGYAADAARERAPRAALAASADPDPARELERIAKLREAGNHADADRALEEFRRRHPGYRIPEPVWDRVKPR